MNQFVQDNPGYLGSYHSIMPVNPYYFWFVGSNIDMWYGDPRHDDSKLLARIPRSDLDKVIYGLTYDKRTDTYGGPKTEEQCLEYFRQVITTVVPQA